MTKLGQNLTKCNPQTIGDLSFRLEALEAGLNPLIKLIERKIERVENARPGYEYAQRELEALLPALKAIEEFRDEMAGLYTAIATAHLEQLEKSKTWDEMFSEAFQLARKFSQDLDRKIALENLKLTL